MPSPPGIDCKARHGQGFTMSTKRTTAKKTAIDHQGSESSGNPMNAIG